jgi:signal transduction histidine kinase
MQDTPHSQESVMASAPSSPMTRREPTDTHGSVRLAHQYLEYAPVPLAVVSGAAHVLVHANAAFRQLSDTGGARAGIGVPIVDTLPSGARDGVDALLDRVRRDGKAVHNAHLGTVPGNEPREYRATWCCDVWPVVEDAGRLDSLVVSVRAMRRRDDIESRQRAVTERLLFTALREQELAQRADSSRARAVFLADANRRLGASVDLETVYATVATIALPKSGAWSIVDVDQPDGSWSRLPIVHPDPMKEAIAAELAQHWLPASGDPIGVPLVAETRQATIVRADIEDVLASSAHGADNLRLLRALELGPLLVVPLVAHQRLRGAITFVSPPAAAPYTAEDVQLATELAIGCAERIDGALLYDGVRLARLNADAARERADMARRDAEHANQVKTSFLTSMSHELRTPLNAILGYTELIAMGLRGPVTGEQVDALGSIRRASRHLLGLINNVLNFARLKALQVRFDSAEGLVSDLFDSAVLMVEPQASAKGLVLVRSSSSPTLTVHGDQDKVLQILLNLLSNAIKFTDSGGRITLAATVLDRRRRVSDAWSVSRGPTAAAVELTVSDTGRGIAPEQLATLFEPFVQVGARLTGMDEGTGLGLAISRDLARGMGGELAVTSTLGVGSTFTLTMPSAAAQ